MKVEDRIRKSLIEIVGEERFTDDLIELVPYAYDASDHDRRPDSAVWPTRVEEVSMILALASAYGFPVTPRGAGTSLTGSAVPIFGGIVMDMCRMDRIIEIRIADRLVVVQPGVVYAHLERALAPHRFFFPPDPASSSVCTIGGNVATNAGGMRGAKYGVTRDYVLGLEVVLADGRILRTGSNCMKSVSGYDLTRLFVGSEGTLGVITEITLKINPMPKAVRTGVAYFNELKNAGKGVTEVLSSGIVPSALEILDENTIRVLREHGRIDLPDAAAMILMETDGYTDADASYQMGVIVDIFRKNEASGVQIADSVKQAEKLWKVRKSIGSVAAQLRPNNVSEDVTVPISKVPDFLFGISEILHAHNLPFVIFGHAGDGNLHPRIMYDRSDSGEVKRLGKAVEAIFRLTCELGGTLSGEHGIGLAKAPYFAMEHDPVRRDLMRSIKRFFDPKNILNPGKIALE
jgi:glycolate oxidase